MAYLIMIIYPIGFLLTLTFFKYFGKQIGFDYDYTEDYDDWDNNATAYLAFSLGWFVVMPILTIVGIWLALVKFSKWYLKL